MNPEFQRNLWLEMTPQRMLVMPVVLLLIYGFALLVDRDRSGMADAAYWVTLLLGALWGTRATAESVTSEVAEGTWDQQRLSSLSPWSMTWGKLFGAPVFVWYGCLPSLLVLVLGASVRMSPGQALLHATLLALMLIFAHAMGLLAGLHAASRRADVSQRATLGLQLVGLIALLPWLFLSIGGYFDGWDDPVRWFGRHFEMGPFLLVNLLVFGAWAILGCYRLMRNELQLRNAPWVWILFVLFCMAYAMGGHDGGIVNTPLSVVNTQDSVAPWGNAMVAAVVLTYLMLFAERKDPVALRRMFGLFAAGNTARATEALPRWLCTLPLVAASAVAIVLLDSSSSGKLGVLALSALLFLLRDAALVMFLNLSPRRRRADAAALVYLLLLYGLVPAMLDAMDLPVWPLLLPSADSSALTGALPAAIQAAVMWALVMRRWSRYWGRASPDAG